jgi:metallo-beta-lactamase class B
MKRYLPSLICSISLFAGSMAIEAHAQADKVQVHVAAAKAAATEPGLFDLTSTFELMCVQQQQRAGGAGGGGRGARGAAAPRVPERSEWYVEPFKVFDNLYMVGTAYYVWALKTSDGIILLNAGREYSAEAVPEGLQKLGLNPADVKYVVIHSGRDMHYGAAKLFQERYHSRVMVSEADWNLIEKTTNYPAAVKPRKDMVITDGQKLTLGDTTLTFYITPGNTGGTVSSLIPLKDGNQRHVGVLVGGRDTNDNEGGVTYFANEEASERAWKASMDRLKDITAKAGADVFLTIRSLYDKEPDKVRALKVRKPGDPHPYVSKTVVSRYLTTISECMDAQLARKATR